MKTKQSRREFLRITATGTLGVIVLSQYGCKSAPKIGLQLYTIRDAMDR